jgi:hypothetical protein
MTKTEKPLPRPFKRLAAAPLDGSMIEVLCGPQQQVVLARWSAQNQAFVRDDDPYHIPLMRVTAWRYPLAM